MSDEANVQAAVNPFELPPIPANEQTTGYWMGTLPGCPVFNVTAGGVTFHRYTDPPTGTDPDSMQTQRAWARGGVEYLTKTQVEAIHRNLKDKVVRFIGNRGQGQIHALGNPNFSRESKDQPLAMFVYMVPLDEKYAMLRSTPGGEYPPSLYHMAGGQAQVAIPKRSTQSADIAPEIEDLDKPIERQHTPPQMRKGSK